VLKPEIKKENKAPKRSAAFDSFDIEWQQDIINHVHDWDGQFYPDISICEWHRSIAWFAGAIIEEFLNGHPEALAMYKNYKEQRDKGIIVPNSIPNPCWDKEMKNNKERTDEKGEE